MEPLFQLDAAFGFLFALLVSALGCQKVIQDQYV